MIYFLLARRSTYSIVAGGGDTGLNEESSALPSRRRQMPIDPSSTLLVAGSLYVGNGLGMKKAPTVFTGKSAKEMLKKIMEHPSS